MTQKQLDLMLEAYRRWVVLGHNEQKPLRERWLGLGTESNYRPVLTAGLMQWVEEKPTPRTMGWLKLTEKGEDIIRRFAAAGVSAKDFDAFTFTAWDKVADHLKK